MDDEQFGGAVPKDVCGAGLGGRARANGGGLGDGGVDTTQHVQRSPASRTLGEAGATLGGARGGCALRSLQLLNNLLFMPLALVLCADALAFVAAACGAASLAARCPASSGRRRSRRRRRTRSSTIVGATSVEQLRENVEAFDVTLTPECLEGIDEVYKLFRDPTND